MLMFQGVFVGFCQFKSVIFLNFSAGNGGSNSGCVFTQRHLMVFICIHGSHSNMSVNPGSCHAVAPLRLTFPRHDTLHLLDHYFSQEASQVKLSCFRTSSVYFPALMERNHMLDFRNSELNGYDEKDTTTQISFTFIDTHISLRMNTKTARCVAGVHLLVVTGFLSEI